MTSFLFAIISSILVYLGTNSAYLGWATFVALGSINDMIRE